MSRNVILSKKVLSPRTQHSSNQHPVICRVFRLWRKRTRYCDRKIEILMMMQMGNARDKVKKSGHCRMQSFGIEREPPFASRICQGESEHKTHEVTNNFGRRSCDLAFNIIPIPHFVTRRGRDAKCCITMKISVSRVSCRTLFSIAACSAVLGPLLDNYHSQFGILAYKNPVEIHLSVAGIPANLTTAPFTPPLFVLAGLIISYGTLSINKAFTDRKFPVFPISVPQAVASIAAFSSIYYLSAAVPSSEFRAFTGPLLTVLAFVEWYFMDRSIGGMVMGGLAGLCGPLVEIGLINIGELYSYSSPELFGIPLFIVAVYFSGGTAVGNLARAIDGADEREREKCKS